MRCFFSELSLLANCGHAKNPSMVNGYGIRDHEYTPPPLRHTTPRMLSPLQLRSLPCQHAFHAGCITPWLTERQRTCPMCKAYVAADQPSSCPGTPNATVMATPGTGDAESTAYSTLLARDRVPLSGSGREGTAGRGGRAQGAAGGDRLPLLLNSRGPLSDGGSIRDSSPV